MSNAGYGNHDAPPRAGAPSDKTKPTPDPIRGGEPPPASAPAGEESPSAGPHADPALTNPDATPGAGSLPSAEDGEDAGSATG